MAQIDGVPILYDSQIYANDSGAAHQPGTIFFWRGGSGRSSSAWVKYVQMDNNGCTQGEVLVQNFATVADYSVAKAGTGDAHCPLRGIAAASISSQYYGFAIIGGYVGSADLSMTCASGDYLTLSGSTAGKLTPLQASPHVVARANGAFGTGIGSITLVGLWG